MNKPVKPIPEGYHAITPYLIIKGAAKAIDFYKNVLGATEVMRMPDPDGKICHAELKIGDSYFMLADEFPELSAISPTTVGVTTVSLLLYVEDADKVFNRALEAGATQLKPLEDQFYGDRSGTIIDPFGHKWTISTHKEDLTDEEIKARLEKMKTK